MSIRGPHHRPRPLTRVQSRQDTSNSSSSFEVQTKSLARAETAPLSTLTSHFSPFWGCIGLYAAVSVIRSPRCLDSRGYDDPASLRPRTRRPKGLRSLTSQEKRAKKSFQIQQKRTRTCKSHPETMKKPMNKYEQV